MGKLFEKQIRYTLDSALAALEQAYQQWSKLDPKKRGKFNITWLQNNGFSGLNDWTYKNGGIESLVGRASQEIQEVFEKKHETYTQETALDTLEQAYEQWSNLDPETREIFNVEWLKRNGFESFFPVGISSFIFEVSRTDRACI